jgi:hypothetical protein
MKAYLWPFDRGLMWSRAGLPDCRDQHRTARHLGHGYVNLPTINNPPWPQPRRETVERRFKCRARQARPCSSDRLPSAPELQR